MTEAMFDILYATDSTVTIALKFLGIVLILKLIISRKNCIKELNKWKYIKSTRRHKKTLLYGRNWFFGS